MASPSSAASTSAPGAAGYTSIRRAATFNDAGPEFRRRSPGHRLSTNADVLPPGPGRRRSSNFSEYSLSEARKSFQSSTDDLLLPKPRAIDQELEHNSSPWHSVPLAFALLPAIGGMLFKNGSLVITDVMLLGLAAIFLNWSVRLPWDWYHSAQAIRANEENIEDQILSGEYEDEDEEPIALKTDPNEAPKAKAAGPSPNRTRPSPAREAATNELYTHEILALLSCFLFPALGAYLLHTIRSQLSRPSEGLVSNYNLTIFLLASELRPMAHLAKLIQSRTLHLQRVVTSNPYDGAKGSPNNAMKDIVQRLDELEGRNLAPEPPSPSESALNSKHSAVLVTEVRKTLQPDLDALNRAVRRYEKRATLQALQTESRLLDLEARLNDAISLAAAAANNENKNRRFTVTVMEWAATAVVLPIQALTAVVSLPFKAIGALVNFRKPRLSSQGPSDNGRKTTSRKHTLYSRTGPKAGR